MNYYGLQIDSASLNQRTPPPSLSLSSDLDNDSNDPNSSNEGNTSGPHGLTDEEIEPPRKQDLIRALTNNWAEYKCRNSDRIFYYNALTKSRSWKPPRLSKEESNNNVFQIPTGWTQSVDELNGTVSFINETTGSKVVTC
ncbi:unnamed protein product [Allacma fusca]|uniref:WW domain-containing protein n=1 Tax=Allacma fusca TaxID=39272 RepID=A0A8J2L7S3_9HEXA|nr:unnamed protein product [Allacma fusca]